MVVNYHFFSTEDDSALGPRNTSYVRENARGGSAYTAVGVGSLTGFVGVLKNIKERAETMQRWLIETHGVPGGIILGNQGLECSNVDSWLADKGFEAVCAPGARIFFNGCNVAEGPSGVQFLSKFGSIFLKHGGGSVAACTSAGIPFFNGRVYHLWGDLVEVFFNADGRVSEVHRQ